VRLERLVPRKPEPAAGGRGPARGAAAPGPGVTSRRWPCGGYLPCRFRVTVAPACRDCTRRSDVPRPAGPVTVTVLARCHTRPSLRCQRGDWQAAVVLTCQ
jgi:hypothetical protein